MKQMIMAVLLCTVALCLQAQEKEEVLIAFKNSPEFERVQKAFSEWGEADFSHATVRYVEVNGKHPYATVPVKQEGKITAVLEFVPVPEKLENVLPNNDRYAMQLTDYRKYDPESQNGEIRALDINYDGYLSALFTVEKGEIIRFDTGEMPEEIRKKYPDVQPVKNDFTGDIAPEYKRHICDRNGNGNVSYGECMKCFKEMCNGYSYCQLKCQLIYGPYALFEYAQCEASLVGACVVIALMY